MRYKLTICLIIFGMLLTLCGCGHGDNSQEIGTPDGENSIILPSESDEEEPDVLADETDEQLPDGNHEATEVEDETQDETEGVNQKVCIVLDESRQKTIDDLIGDIEDSFSYSVPVVIGEGDYVDEVNTIISDYYDEVLLPQCELLVEGGYAALEKEYGEVMRCSYSWKAETYNGIVSLMISRHILYDMWDYQFYAFLPDGTKATREDFLNTIGWTEEQFQNAVREGIRSFYPSEEELGKYNERDREWINGRMETTFQNLLETESINLYLTTEGELLIQTAIVPLAGPEREVVVFSASDFKNLSSECKYLDNSSDTEP